jgi:transposase-like protein
MTKAYRTLLDIEKAFPDWKSCYIYLEKLRWGGQPKSPYADYAVERSTYNHQYYCRITKRKFNVLTGTLFEKTKMPLQDWFKIIWLFTVRPEISTSEASRQTGINQKTVWNMQQRIVKWYNNKTPMS